MFLNPRKFVLDLSLGGVLLGVVLVCVAVVLHRRRTHDEFLDYGLFGVVGRMGQGKSYFLSLVALRARRSGRPVFANFWLKDSVSFEEYLSGAVGVPVRVSNWHQVVSVPDGSVVLLDEVQLWWNSRMWNAPIEVESWISQLRKRGMSCYWATQDIGFASKRLRALSFGIWECRRYKRGHVYSQYEPIQAGRVTLSKRPTLASMTVVRSKNVQDNYDTYGLVESSVEWSGVEPDSRGDVRAG